MEEKTKEQLVEQIRLSPEEKAVLESKRLVVRKLKAWMDEKEANYIGADLAAAGALLNVEFDKFSQTMKVSDLKIVTDNEDLLALLAIINDSTISDACMFLEGSTNAVNSELRHKTKDVKVKDLDIKLL